MRATVVLLTLILAGTAGSVSGADYGIIPGSAVRLGTGFNALEPGEAYPSCITATKECQAGKFGAIGCISGNDPTNSASNAPSEFAPSTTFDIRQIKSKYDFFDELNISASLSGSYGAFSGSASFSLHSVDDIDQNSVSWAITAKSDFGSYELAVPKLSNDYGRLNAQQLLDTCGPEYVARVDRGVVASVLYTFHSESEEKLRQVSASLSAGIETGAWGASGGASFSDFVKQLSSYGQVSINVFAIGGQGSAHLSDLIKADPTDLPTVEALIADYVKHQTSQTSAILGFGTGAMGKFVGHPEVDANYEAYTASIAKLAAYRQQLLDWQKVIDTETSHLSDFGADVQNIKLLGARLQCEIQVVEQTASNCRELNYKLTQDSVQATAGASLSKASTISNAFLFRLREGGGVTTSSVASNTADSQPPQSQSPLPDDKQCTARIAMVDGVSRGLLVTGDDPAKLIQAVGDEACDVTKDVQLLADLQELRPYPFDFNYYFDDYGNPTNTKPVFPSSNPQEVLYARFSDASEIAFVEVRDWSTATNQFGATTGTVGAPLLHMESNSSGADHFGFSVPLGNGLKGKVVALSVTTTSGGNYNISLEVPNPP